MLFLMISWNIWALPEELLLFKYGIIRAEKSAAVSAFPSTAGGYGKNGTGALSAAVRVKTAWCCLPFDLSGLLLCIFRFLEQIMNFRCQNNCENRWTGFYLKRSQIIWKIIWPRFPLQDFLRNFFQEDYFNRLIKTQTGLTYTEYYQLLLPRRAETRFLRPISDRPDHGSGRLPQQRLFL